MLLAALPAILEGWLPAFSKSRPGRRAEFPSFVLADSRSGPILL
jgi:hypothetical protein